MTRTALVTGGSGGLGVAVVAQLLDDGWRVVVPWIAERELERLPERDGLITVQADLREDAGVTAAVEAAAGEAGAPLRGLANLVGGFDAPGRLHEAPADAFFAQVELNLKPTALVTRAVVPHMIEAGGGSVVCVGTRAAVRPFSGAAGYVVGKAAVLAFVDAMAVEYRDDDVRVNAVLPSVIDTAANRAAMPDADHAAWVTPATIAQAIGWLLGDGSGATSGAHLPVYGRA